MEGVSFFWWHIRVTAMSVLDRNWQLFWCWTCSVRANTMLPVSHYSVPLNVPFGNLSFNFAFMRLDYKILNCCTLAQFIVEVELNIKYLFVSRSFIIRWLFVKSTTKGSQTTKSDWHCLTIKYQYTWIIIQISVTLVLHYKAHNIPHYCFRPPFGTSHS